MYVVVFWGVQYDSFSLNFHTFSLSFFFLSIISISNNEHWNTNLLQSNITKNIHLKSSVSFFIKTICEIHFFKFLNSASLEREKLLVLIFFFSSIRGFFLFFSEKIHKFTLFLFCLREEKNWKINQWFVFII